MKRILPLGALAALCLMPACLHTPAQVETAPQQIQAGQSLVLAVTGMT